MSDPPPIIIAASLNSTDNNNTTTLIIIIHQTDSQSILSSPLSPVVNVSLLLHFSTPPIHIPIMGVCASCLGLSRRDSNDVCHPLGLVRLVPMAI